MSKLDSFRLDNEVIFKGYWTTNIEDLYKKDDICLEKAIPGDLKIENGRVTVDLNGNFNKSSFKCDNSISEIYGYLSTGIFVSLKNCINIVFNFSVPGYGTAKYIANELNAYSTVLNNKEELESVKNINKIEFSISYLNELYNLDLPEVIKDESNNMIITFINDFFGNNEFKILDGEYYVSFKRDTLFIKHFDKVPDINYDYYISVYSKKFKESLIDKFKDISNWLLRLFNFLTQTWGEYLYFKYINEDEVNCRRVEELENGIHKYYYPNYQGRLVFPQISIPNSGSLCDKLKLTDIIDNFESIISKWFKNKEKLKYIIDLYVQNLSPNIAVELALINKIRMLETYNDNFQNVVIGETNEAESNTINESKETKGDMISKSKTKEKNINRLDNHDRKNPSLKNKLVFILKNIPDNLKRSFSIINKDWEKEELFIDDFAKKLKDTRNYYTHTANEEKNINRLKTMDEMIAVSQVLDYIIYYWVLKVLLDDDKKILDLPFFRRVIKNKKNNGE